MAPPNFKKRALVSLLALALTAAAYLILHLLIQAGIIGPFIRGILNVACINIVAAVSLNLVTGLLGQLVLGHAGFMLIGAYTSALITKSSALALGLSLPLSLLAGGLMAALVGLVIALPALRVRGDYLAIVTLGFGEIIRVVANNLAFTGGPAGLPGIKSLTTKQNPSGMFNLIFPVTAFVIFFSYTFGTSRHGRAVRSIREDEIAAESSGVHTTYYKLLTFTLAALFAGIAGGLYAHQIGVIAPSRFDFNRSVEILMMVVLGGMGSITGAVISATFLTALPELLRSAGKLLANVLPGAMTGFFNNFDQYRMLIYSVLLICVMLFRPKGLLGRSEMRLTPLVDAVRRPRRRAARKKGGAS